GSTDGVAYSLSADSSGGGFAIDASTGVVTVANGSKLDFEAAAQHSVTVVATSEDGSTSSQTFTIDLTDQDEFDVSAVSDTDAAAKGVAEKAANGAVVGVTAFASDADGSTNGISYSLSSDSSGGGFAVDATTGVVTVADGSKLDFEAAAQHTVTVVATSEDGSTSSQTFTIDLVDEAGPTNLRYSSLAAEDSGEVGLIGGFSGNLDEGVVIARLADGGYVMAAQPDNAVHGSSGHDLFAQRFDADGAPAGGIFQVNSTTSGDQRDANVVGLKNGGFVLTWESQNQDGSGFGVYGRQYNSSGSAIGGEFRINSTTSNEQSAPSVTALEDGGYVVTWQSDGQDGSDFGVYAQRYNSSGTKVGGEVRVNTHTTFNQSDSDVEGLSDGGYVVAWESFNQDGDRDGIYLQRFDASGTKVGSEIQVNDVGAGDQDDPTLAALDDGGFIVAWEDGSRIVAQRFDENGDRVDANFIVSADTSSPKQDVEAIGLDNGGFLVTWVSDGQDGSGQGVYAQMYDAAGDPIGDEMRINDTTADHHGAPAVTQREDGTIV
ncbi:MAG: cadherin repeat domain-containing protein, partial [Alphaproteobacteria bacterium]